MDKKAKEIYKHKPKLDRRTKRRIKRRIDKDIKAGKYDDLKEQLIKAREDGLNNN